MLAIDRLRGGARCFQPFGGTCRKGSVVFDDLLGEKCSRPAGAKAILESRWEGGETRRHSFLPDECQPDGREVM
jgi:hypothetical protein